MRRMTSDFLSGDPQSLERFFNFLSGGDIDPNYPDLKGQYQAAFTNMIMKGPEALQRLAPHAYDEFLDNVTKPLIEGAYQHAAATGKPEDLTGAKWFDYLLTGQYKTELPKAQDPAQFAQNQLSTREQQIAEREATLMKQSWGAFNPETGKWNAFYAELDRTLAPIKANYDEKIWPAIRDHVARQAIDKMKADQLWGRDHQNALRGLEQAFQQRWKGGRGYDDLKPSVQAFQNDFLLRARRVIPSVAADVLKAAAAKPAAQAQPAARTTAPQKPQTQRAANGQFTQAQRDAAKSKLLDDLAATGF